MTESKQQGGNHEGYSDGQSDSSLCHCHYLHLHHCLSYEFLVRCVGVTALLRMVRIIKKLYRPPRKGSPDFSPDFPGHFSVKFTPRESESFFLLRNNKSTFSRYKEMWIFILSENIRLS